MRKFFFFKDIDDHYNIYFLGIKLSFKHKSKYIYKPAIEYGVNKIKRNPQIIVSLTSHPERIKTVHLTINTLLRQTLKPDKVILWLADSQFPNKENDLPVELLNLKKLGLSIEWCDDLKSYKKLIPSLKKYPNDIIIITDDDVFYDEYLVENLYSEYLKNNNQINVRRAVKLELNNNNIEGVSSRKYLYKDNFEPTFFNQIMGGSGCLIPPNCLYKDITNFENIKQLLPTHDDVYIWAMAILNKRKIKIVGGHNINLHFIPNTQDCGLIHKNKKNNNEGISLENAYKVILKKYPEILDILKQEKKDNEIKQDRIFINFLGLKITLRKNKLSNNKIKKLNYKYENIESKERIPKVKSAKETLDILLSTQKSICRFGDGEFNLIFGEDLPFQDYKEELKKRLIEILQSNNDNILIGIPNSFGSLEQYNQYGANFWRKYCVYNREKIYKYINFNNIYYDTEVTRPYMDVKDREYSKIHFQKFKELWNNKNIIFVEGEGSRLGLGNDLFSTVKNIKRIICPAKNAYKNYSKIFEICKTLPKDSLFLLALGPTATVLAYDLALEGYRAIDLGHLDIEYEWFLKKAKKKIPIRNKYVNEARNGKKITKINDTNYFNQIYKYII